MLDQTDRRPKPAAALNDLYQRLHAQLRQSGAGGTARLVAGQLEAAIRLDEAHVWYELDLTACTLPDFALDESFTVHRATEADLERFAGIPPVTAYYARERMAAGSQLWYVAEGERIAFFCWLLRGEAPTLAVPDGSVAMPAGTLNLEDSTTVPEFRSRSIGAGALVHILGRLRAEGVGCVVTKVGLENTPTQRWVAKLGFTQVAVTTVRRRGRRWTRSVEPTPGAENGWLIRGLQGEGVSR